MRCTSGSFSSVVASMSVSRSATGAVGEHGFGLPRPRRQHVEPLGTGLLQRCQPQCGLADAGLALEQETRRVLIDRREELGNRAQLDRPAHHTDRHVPIMTASKPRCRQTEGDLRPDDIALRGGPRRGRGVRFCRSRRRCFAARARCWSRPRRCRVRLNRRSLDTDGRPIKTVRALYRGDRIAFGTT